VEVMVDVFGVDRTCDEVTAEHWVGGRETVGIVQEVRRAVGRTSHNTVFTQTDSENTVGGGYFSPYFLSHLSDCHHLLVPDLALLHVETLRG